jgi:O-antigen biosynthesis protein WbqP
MIRFFDILLCSLGLFFLWPVLAVLTLIGWFDTGSPLFLQERVGRHKRPFTLVKFRTMKPDTAHVATHLADASAVTALGGFLRRTKLDELPQLWNVLRGDMSLVGPRPCLLTQSELISERDRRRVFEARPGVTGLAQVSGIDMSTPQLLAETDARMLGSLGVKNYFHYLLMTAMGKGSGDRIRNGQAPN